MRRVIKIVWVVMPLMALLLLVGPKAGGEGGISGSGLYRGTLQRFGSIFVNDMELETQDATILLDGVPGTQQDLRVGQQLTVTVDAPADDGAAPGADDAVFAATVLYYSDVVAPVEQVDPVAGTITALGQEIVAFSGTYLDGVDLYALKRGAWIEVSGQRSGESSLLATYVGASAPAQAALRGVVSAVPDGVTLVVAGVTVDTSSANGDLPAVGDEVRVAGSLLPAGVLVAANVLKLDTDAAATADFVSLQGVLDDGLQIGATRIEPADGTLFSNGTAEDLVQGARIEAEGRISAGVLHATRIQFNPVRTIEADGMIGDVSIASLEYQTGVVNVLGIGFQLSSGTRFGNSGSSLQELSAGDRVRIRAYVDSGGVAVSRIDRLQPDGDAELVAVVSAITENEIMLLDRAVPLSDAIRYGVAGVKVGAAEFAAAVHVGDFVRVRWRDSADGSALPQRMELVSPD